jgi:HSP20 family protein
MALLSWRPVNRSMERWEPFRDLSDMQSEMGRLLEGVFGRQMPGTSLERVWTPAVDMYETKDDLVITAELPGMNEKDIKLSVHGDMLSLRGERMQVREVMPEGAYRGERWFGKFERTLPLPIPVQTDKVKAIYRDGVLTITLPKAEENKPKEIAIEVQ